MFSKKLPIYHYHRFMDNDFYPKKSFDNDKVSFINLPSLDSFNTIVTYNVIDDNYSDKFNLSDSDDESDISDITYDMCSNSVDINRNNNLNNSQNNANNINNSFNDIDFDINDTKNNDKYNDTNYSTKMLGKRNYKNAFGINSFEIDRYGQIITNNYFDANIGHGVHM